MLISFLNRNNSFYIAFIISHKFKYIIDFFLNRRISQIKINFVICKIFSSNFSVSNSHISQRKITVSLNFFCKLKKFYPYWIKYKVFLCNHISPFYSHIYSAILDAIHFWLFHKYWNLKELNNIDFKV